MRWQTAISFCSTSPPNFPYAFVRNAEAYQKTAEIRKTRLTKRVFCGMMVVPLCGGAFFVPLRCSDTLFAVPRMMALTQDKREANFRFVCKKTEKFSQEVPKNAC